MVQGQMDKALSGFEDVLQRFPNHQASHYYKGIILFRTHFYEEAYPSFALLCKMEDLEESFTDSWFYAGKSLFMQKEFEDAIPYFDGYLETGAVFYRSESIRYISNAFFAAEAMKNPVSFEPQLVDLPLNEGQSVYLPMKSLDGNLLFYTLREMGRERLVFSNRLDKRKYGESIVPEFLLPYRHTAASSLSPDGNLLLVTICNHPTGLGSCDLYLAFQRAGKWEGPYNLGEPVNTPGWESQPSFGPDGRTFYFSSERPGGFGGRDIWYSRILDDGNFMEPVNMGPAINTSGNEESPFMHPDGKSFYFNSNGHAGMGDYDIYLSRIKQDGEWGKSQNLGYPINTVYHDGALYVDSDGKTAYVASDRLQPPNFRGIYQIFTFELPAEAAANPVTYIRATVKDARTKRPLAAKVRLTDWNTGEDLIHRSLGASGSLFAVLPSGNSYVFNAALDGYNFVSARFEPDSNASAQNPYLLDIEMTELSIEDTAQVKQYIVLENVLFQTASAELEKGSYTELEQLADFLKANKKIRIELHGHTDNIGRDEDNLILSDLRAKAVLDFLVEKGVDKERMTARGYGANFPVADNDTEKGRQKNRRTELYIMSSGQRP